MYDACSSASSRGLKLTGFMCMTAGTGWQPPPPTPHHRCSSTICGSTGMPGSITMNGGTDGLGTLNGKYCAGTAADPTCLTIGGLETHLVSALFLLCNVPSLSILYVSLQTHSNPPQNGNGKVQAPQNTASCSKAIHKYPCSLPIAKEKRKTTCAPSSN